MGRAEVLQVCLNALQHNDFSLIENQSNGVEKVSTKREITIHPPLSLDAYSDEKSRQ
jgi:hypothetical protein